MSRFDPSFADPASTFRSGDDLDGLLRQFFQAEMPDPWPRLVPPEAASAPAPVRWRGWTLLRSRLALAASLALLVGGQLLLAGSYRSNEAARPRNSRKVAKDPRTPAHPIPRPQNPDARPSH